MPTIKRFRAERLRQSDHIPGNSSIRNCGVAIGLFLTLRHTYGIEGTTPVMFGILALAVVVVAAISWKRRNRVSVSYPMSAFVAACVLSLVAGKPEPSAICWTRLAGFAIALAALSPLIDSALFRDLRNGIWKGWWIGAMILTCASFAILLYAVLTSRMSDYLYFGFRGAMPMGMSLSPMAALTAIFALNKAVNSKSSINTADNPESRIGRWRRLAWPALFCAAALTSIAAGSRIAVAGLLLGSAIIAFYAVRKNKKIVVRLVLPLGIILATASAAFPAVNATIRDKATWAMEAGSPFSSRVDKWEGRIAEFKSAPLTGIGFGAQTVFNSPYDNKEEILRGRSPEPGSSWLSLPAQTGLLGTAAFLAFLVPAINALTRKPFPTAVLAFLLLNGVCEGWLLYSSALLFPCFWLTTSLTDDRIPQS